MLMLSLKDLHRPHDITTVFELAHARDPGNVEVMNGLFNSYIRCDNRDLHQLMVLGSSHSLHAYASLSPSPGILERAAI